MPGTILSVILMLLGVLTPGIIAKTGNISQAADWVWLWSCGLILVLTGRL